MASASASSIDPKEVEQFSRIAAEWWDPKGKFAPLHKFNPVRLAFIREQALARFGRDPKAVRPFEGLRLLDIGCGGGLLCEPMSRLGFSVTGVDASERNIGTASTHAAEQGLSIDYWASTAEDLLAAGEAPFDVVLNMEVIEHVADPRGFLDGEPVAVQGPFGVAYDPLSGRWGRSSDCDINYMMTVTRDAA